MTLTFWRILVSYFIEYPSIWLYLVFSHERLGLGRMPQRWGALTASHPGYTASPWFTTDDVDLGHLVKAVSARFVTVKLSFYHTHLKVNHQVQPTLKGREIKLHLLARGDIYIYYLELFWKKDVYLVSHLFIQSFVYICMTHGHCLLWAIISYTCYVFSCSNCSSFGHWELLQIGS